MSDNQQLADQIINLFFETYPDLDQARKARLITVIRRDVLKWSIGANPIPPNRVCENCGHPLYPWEINCLDCN